jgi:hypothetical protein
MVFKISLDNTHLRFLTFSLHKTIFIFSWISKHIDKMENEKLILNKNEFKSSRSGKLHGLFVTLKSNKNEFYSFG